MGSWFRALEIKIRKVGRRRKENGLFCPEMNLYSNSYEFITQLIIKNQYSIHFQQER